jgi:queuosine precursor transporter
LAFATTPIARGSALTARIDTGTTHDVVPTSSGFRYYDLVLGGFVAVLLCSNLIGVGKTVLLALPFGLSLSFGAGNLFFPISYIFGDVLTEVYGYARARRAIWCGAGGLLFATLMSTIILGMPADPSEPYNQSLQPALEVVFGSTWRIVAGSVLAFWVGDFVNSYVLAKMKLRTRGRLLWARTIGSTIVGQLVDSLVFYPIAFYGIWTTSTLVKIVIFNWGLKVLVEVLFTPLTYLVINGLKRAEGADHFDVGTNFTPFSLD